MKIVASSPENYIEQLPEDRQVALQKLRQTILDHLPEGSAEAMSYGMLGYVVPHSLYPAGYHCKPEEALPFISIASQKNFIGFYHMGMYANPDLLEWFVAEYPKHCDLKLDMGKSCVRFKKIDKIPYDLIGQLVEKMTPQEWIELYETNLKR